MAAEATGQDPAAIGTAKAPKKNAAEKTASQKFELKTPKVGRVRLHPAHPS